MLVSGTLTIEGAATTIRPDVEPEAQEAGPLAQVLRELDSVRQQSNEQLTAILAAKNLNDADTAYEEEGETADAVKGADQPASKGKMGSLSANDRAG